MSERKRVILVVFDGLRRDMMTPALMPNLDRFRRRSVDFPLSRTVFPSETRVAVSSLVTGHHPGDHGIVANAFVSRSAGRIYTSRLADLDRLAAARGGRLLQRASLGERLAAAGRRMAVVSTASPGATRLLNHRAGELGHVTISAHGAEASQPASALDAAIAHAGPVPPGALPNTERLHWSVDVLLDHLVPGYDPDLAILWLSDPDSTWHYRGIGSPEGLAALTGADAAFGRVLDRAAAEPEESRPAILVMSDHGHITARETIDLPSLVDTAFPGTDHQPGYSGGISLSLPDPAERARVARWLLEQPWCGHVITRGGDGGVGLVPGSFDRRLLGCEHEDAPDLYYLLATEDGVDGNGIDGSCLFHNAVPIGGSMHGGLHPRELANVLVVGGRGARAGHASPLPAGTVDVAPTILTLLGLPGADGMAGRVLHEALSEEPHGLAGITEETRSGGRTVRRWRIGQRAYLDMATAP
ncbi:MAG: alkaline phosphatase family protein [Alphaproteobacteria bacterium]|nr:alkaline phosphatase family protein [Alphaproteobacteria bacterium]